MIAHYIYRLSVTLSSLLELSRRAFNHGYEFAPSFGVDYVTTRAQRTAKRPVVALDIYEDGSGFEVAFLGKVFMLGAEAKSTVPH